jgi:TrmH family RNA methyltransferase
MDITSLQNPRIKQFVKLRDDKKQRLLSGMMLVEGWDEISLAIKAGYIPQTLLVAPELTDRQSSGISSEIITITKSVFKKVSFRENPDGWLAVIPTPHKTLNDLKLNP